MSPKVWLALGSIAAALLVWLAMRPAPSSTVSSTTVTEETAPADAPRATPAMARTAPSPTPVSMNPVPAPGERLAQDDPPSRRIMEVEPDPEADIPRELVEARDAEERRIRDAQFGRNRLKQ